MPPVLGSVTPLLFLTVNSYMPVGFVSASPFFLTVQLGPSSVGVAEISIVIGFESVL